MKIKERKNDLRKTKRKKESHWREKRDFEGIFFGEFF